MKKQSPLKTALISALFAFTLGSLNAEVFFSGFAGGKFDFGSNSLKEFDPALHLQSFFSGQLNLSENIIAHTEFSLATEDLIENSVFKETPGSFKIDELSIIFRRQLLDATNYLSFFAGTYEPIGSDIFLRRQFGIQPIASRITENWLGLSGSVIYPMFGVGGSDVLHLNIQPVALGLYIYVNHELDDCYSFNTDARFAGVYRFFTFDLSGGIGVPLKQDSSEDAFIIVDTLYGRAGVNLLIGNSYTSSLFVQAGISEVPFSKSNKKITLDEEKTYLLIEPRFRTKNFQLNITVFSLPQDTVDGFRFINATKENNAGDFEFVHDTLGINFDIFTDHLYIKNKIFEFGINSALTFTDKTFKDLVKDAKSLFSDNDTYNVLIAPYLSTRFYTGEVHGMLQARVTDLVRGNFASAFTLNLGFKTQL